MLSETAKRTFRFWFGSPWPRGLHLVITVAYAGLVEVLLVKKAVLAPAIQFGVLAVTCYLLFTVDSFLVMYLPAPENRRETLHYGVAFETLAYLIATIFLGLGLVHSLASVGLRFDSARLGMRTILLAVALGVYGLLRGTLRESVLDMTRKKEIGLVFGLIGAMWIAGLVAELHVRALGI